jgi:uncharacterized protein YyaL (SSP411 family)
MAEIARRQCVPGAIRLELDPARTEHAAQLDLLGYPGDEVPAAYVCAGGRCLEPARTPEELVGRLAELCD